MPHTLPANTCLGDFDAAAVADHTFVTDLFIFTTVTFPVLARPENLFTEQTILFRLQRPVIDGFRLFHLASGPFANLFRRRQPDFDGIKRDRLPCCLPAHCLWHL